MFIGGTNFGFMNGANGGGASIQVDPTSYDYDAPLTEAGDLTPKYEAIRNKIAEWTDVPSYDVKDHPKANYGKVEMEQTALLFDNLDVLDPNPVKNETPLNFEKLDLAYGYVLYRTTLKRDGSELVFHDIHDRALVYVNGNYVDMVLRSAPTSPVKINAKEGDVLDIFVENQGRINFGGGMTDRKVSEAYI